MKKLTYITLCLLAVPSAILAATPEGMVLISGGSFSMGDSFSEGDSDELPVHTVYVSAFYMDRYEVTKAKWDEVADWAEDHDYDIHPAGGSGKATNHPVHSVSWYECVKWCNARSEKEGRLPAYYTNVTKTPDHVYRTGSVAVQNGWVRWDTGYRLPTEAEWEKGARGGLSGQRFPWGANINHDFANYKAYGSAYSYDTSPYTSYTYHPDYDDGGHPYSSPVWNFAANGYGLHDMAGNMNAWCWDRYDSDYYDVSEGLADPRGPESGTLRVVRSGSWNNAAVSLRVSQRDGGNPSNQYDEPSFRAVLPSEGQEPAIVLEGRNPGDGQSIRLEWNAASPTGYKIYRRPAGSTGDFQTLQKRWHGTAYIDTGLSRNETNEYKVAARGSQEISNTVTGKTEHVVVLVRGLNRKADDDHSTYWTNLQPYLVDDGYTVWNACDDGAVPTPKKITGTKAFHSEAVTLQEYVNEKLSAYGSTYSYPAPDCIDMIAHSMGALTARTYIKDTGDTGFIRELITLAGAHCGSPLADPSKAASYLSWDALVSPEARPAVQSLRPIYLEHSGWFDLLGTPDGGTRIHVAAGTGGPGSSDLGLDFFARVLKLMRHYPNDGAVSEASASGQYVRWVRIPTGIPSQYLYLKRERQTFLAAQGIGYSLDHSEMKGDSSGLRAWIKSVLGAGGGAKSMALSSSLESVVLSETSITNAPQLVMSTNSVLAISNTNVHPFTVDTCESLDSYVVTTNDVVIALQRPDGSIIDAETAATNTSITYTPPDGSGIVGYNVSSPTNGIWQMLVSPSNGLAGVDSYQAFASVVNPVGADFFCAPSWTVTGDTVVVACTFGLSTQFVSSATVAACVYDSTNQILSCTLFDDGQHQDGGTNDGLFAYAWAAVTNTGTFSIRYDVAGVRTNGQDFVRVGFSDAAVSTPKVRFTGSFTNWTQDMDTNSLSDSLIAAVEIEALTSGDYAISAVLSSSDGSEIDSAVSTALSLSQGQATNLVLSFLGTKIEASGVDGPYSVGPVYALDSLNDNVRVGVSGVYTTETYAATSFEARDTDSDGVPDGVEATLGTNPDLIDTDGDGISDYDELNQDGNPTNYTIGVDLDPTSVDTDNDGMWDNDELTAGTSPVNGDDVFEIDGCSAVTNPVGVVLFWDTATGRFYTVYSNTNLLSTWTNVFQTSGDGSQKSYTNTEIQSIQRFFRLGVEQE